MHTQPPNKRVALQIHSNRLAGFANLAAGGLYVCLLAAWLPGPILDGIIASFASCSPLPNVRRPLSACNCL